MRKHHYKLHTSSKSIVDAIAGVEAISSKERKRILRNIRSWGMWAFVRVPFRKNEECTVHYWFRKNKDPFEVAQMIGHELGHIADGGPKGDDEKEERRADEFGDVAKEVASFLESEGLALIGRTEKPAKRRRKRR